MSAKQHKQTNRVWIELELDYKDKAINHQRAKLATAMLRRLGYPSSKFWFYDDKGRYCITINEAGSFLECSDNGHWFDLDFLGK